MPFIYKLASVGVYEGFWSDTALIILKFTVIYESCACINNTKLNNNESSRKYLFNLWIIFTKIFSTILTKLICY